MLETVRGIIQKYREVILYLVFGVLSMALSIGLFSAFSYGLKMNELIANIFSWILVIVFVYYTNKKWVFQKETHGQKEGMKEFFAFVLGRISTLVLEEAVLFLGITIMGINGVFVKTLAQVLVVVGNYIISKFIVFKKD